MKLAGSVRSVSQKIREQGKSDLLLHAVEEMGEMGDGVHAPDVSILSWWRGLAAPHDPLHLKEVRGYCQDAETASQILGIHERDEKRPGLFAKCEIKVSFLWKVGFTMKITHDSRKQWIGKWCRLIRACETIDPAVEYEVELEESKDIINILGGNLSPRKRTQGFYTESSDGLRVAKLDLQYENDGRVFLVSYKSTAGSPRGEDEEEDKAGQQGTTTIPAVTIRPAEQGLGKNYYRVDNAQMIPGMKYGARIFQANALADGSMDVADIEVQYTVHIVH
jgi:hypothetical protein